jgi:hypothetical protein
VTVIGGVVIAAAGIGLAAAAMWAFGVAAEEELQPQIAVVAFWAGVGILVAGIAMATRG